MSLELRPEFFDAFSFGPNLQLLVPTDIEGKTSSPINEGLAADIRSNLIVAMTGDDEWVSLDLDDVLDAPADTKPKEPKTQQLTLARVLEGRVHTGYRLERTNKGVYIARSTEFALWGGLDEGLDLELEPLETRYAGSHERPFRREVFSSVNGIDLVEQTPSVKVQTGFLGTLVTIGLDRAGIEDTELKSLAYTLYQYAYGITPVEVTSKPEEDKIVVSFNSSAEGDDDDAPMNLAIGQEAIHLSLKFAGGRAVAVEFAEEIRNEITRQRTLQKADLRQLALDLSRIDAQDHTRRQAAVACYRQLSPRHNASLHGVFPGLRSRIALRAT